MRIAILGFGHMINHRDFNSGSAVQIYIMFMVLSIQPGQESQKTMLDSQLLSFDCQQVSIAVSRSSSGQIHAQYTDLHCTINSIREETIVVCIVEWSLGTRRVDSDCETSVEDFNILHLQSQCHVRVTTDTSDRLYL